MSENLVSMNMRQRCPRHPGYILNTLYIKPLSLTISHLASVLSVSRKTVSAIVNERKSITPDMALRLSQAFPNTTPESWLTLQRNFDIWKVSHTTSQWKTIHPISVTLDERKEALNAHS